MFKRDWIITLAIVLSLYGFCNPVQAYEGEQSSGKHGGAISSQKDARASDLKAIKESVDSVAAAIKADTEKPEAEDATQRAKDDLRAQQQAAWGSITSSIATWLSFVVSLAGLIYLIKTVAMTKASLKHAETQAEQAIISAKAAIDSVKITREIGEATARAYFGSHHVTIEWNGTTREEGGLVVARLKNKGGTHALNCVTYYDFFEAPSLSDDPVIDKFEADWLNGVESDCVDQGEVVRRSGISISGSDLEEFHAGTKEIAILTVVTYEDIFGKKFVRSSCSVPVFPSDAEPNVINFRTFQRYNFHREIKE